MNFFGIVLEFLNSIWTWMTPGVQALASWGALLPASVGFIAALAALRTFRLRTRVDHADQWWKRVQYGLELAKSDSIADQAMGSLILGTLNSPMKPQHSENPWSSKHQQGTSAPTLKVTVGKAFDRLKAHGKFRKSIRDGWLVSRREAAMLASLSRLISDEISGESVRTDELGPSDFQLSTGTRQAIRDGIVDGLRAARLESRIGTKTSRKWWK